MSNKYTDIAYNHKDAIVFLLCSAFVYFSYDDVLEYGFLHWDSYRYIIQNECIQSLSLENLACLFTETYFANWHPITSLSYSLEYHFFGANPGPYHVSNLFLHIVNSYFLYVIVSKVMVFIGKEEKVSVFSGLICSLLFAVHPQHVETVAWIADRKGLLSTTFLLLSFLFYFRYVTGDKVKNKKNYVFSIFIYSLAAMSKPMAVTWPVLLLICDIYPLNRMTPDLSVKRSVVWFRILLEKLPFFAISFVTIVMTIIAQDKFGSIAGFDVIGLGDRFLNMIHSVYLYIYMWILPFKLSPFYLYPEFIVEKNWSIIILVVCLFLAINLYALYIFKKGKYQFFCIWFFILVALSPVSGVIQVGSQAAADRYTYLSLIPLFILFSCYFSTQFYQSTLKVKYIILCILLATISVMGIVTKYQSRIWKNDIVLWTFAMNSGYRLNAITVLSLAQSYYDIHDYEKALKYFLLADDMGKFPIPNYYISFARTYAVLGMDHYSLQIYKFMQNETFVSETMLPLIENDLAKLKKRMNNGKK